MHLKQQQNIDCRCPSVEAIIYCALAKDTATWDTVFTVSPQSSMRHILLTLFSIDMET